MGCGGGHWGSIRGGKILRLNLEESLLARMGKLVFPHLFVANDCGKYDNACELPCSRYILYHLHEGF